jgi:hypothetical protein
MKDCEEMVNEQLKDRLDNIREICRKTREEEDANFMDMIHKFGLGFGYVREGTFVNQDEGYFQWKISYGDPGDEFRFFVRPSVYGFQVVSVEYWFFDCFDKVSRELKGADLQLLKWVFNFFEEEGLAEGIM